MNPHKTIGAVALVACIWMVATTFLLFGTYGCARGTHQSVPHHPEALIIYPGAKETNWVKFEGTDQLSYQIAAEYPADGVVAYISAQLKEKRWQPLQEDFWNPGQPSSHVRGWVRFADATVHPEATVDAWAGQWRNDTDDIVWYYLTYKYPPGDRHSLAVNAGFVPASIARKVPKSPKAQK